MDLRLHISLNNLTDVKRLLDQTPSLINSLVFSEFPLYMACKYDHVEIVDELISRGSIITSQSYPDNQKRTPLHAACSYGRVRLVEILLQHGAHIETVDSVGDTALHDAAIGNHLDVIKLLVKHGASLHVVNNKGLRPLDSTTDIKCIIFLLLAENMQSFWNLRKLIPSYENLLQFLSLENMLTVMELTLC